MTVFTRFGFLLIAVIFGIAGASMARAASINGVGLTLFADGLASPVAMVNAPNGLFYVAELSGKIRVLNQDGSLRPQPAINLADPQFSCRWLGQTVTMPLVRIGEGGLLNLAVDPNFNSNLRLYFYYTTANTLVLARMRFAPISQDSLVPNSCEVLLQLPLTGHDHVGGSLAFSAEGFLNLGIGNNHRGCEQITSPSQASQFGFNCTSAGSIGGVAFNQNAGYFRGKVIRLNVNLGSAAGHRLCGVPNNMPALYRAPAENSFGPADKCPEIFAYGLRNPWRMNVDRITGDLTIGDVGENRFEELDFLMAGADFLIESGANLGWPCFEGLFQHSSTGVCSKLTLGAIHQPVMVFPSEQNFRTVIGGYRYRGPSSEFNGFYLGADASSGRVVMAESPVPAPIGQQQIGWDYIARNSLQMYNTTISLSYPVSLAQDNQGNLFILDINAAIYQFTFNADVEFQSGFER